MEHTLARMESAKPRRRQPLRRQEQQQQPPLLPLRPQPPLCRFGRSHQTLALMESSH
jgi:hypothetical protein